MTNKERSHGGWSFVDQDNQPITDLTLIEGWTFDFALDPGGEAYVEILPYAKDPSLPYMRTYLSKLNGTTNTKWTATSPQGEVFEFADSIVVVNSAFGQPAASWSEPEAEE